MLFFSFAAIFCAIAGCSRKGVQVPSAPGIVRNDNSYLDLEPGWTVKIVVPLLKSGGYLPNFVAQKSEGNTILYSAPDPIGYTTSFYLVSGKKNGDVRLKFVSAEETRDGKKTSVGPPALPFELPRKAERIRLVYLVRVSKADHNMAIVGARRLEKLNSFTKQLKEDPNICAVSDEIFCAWVPPGVAVRREDH